MRRFLRLVVRFSVVWAFEALSLLVLHWLVPGISLSDPEGVGIATVAMSVALVLAVVNGLIRPVVVMLALPLNMITLGLFTLVINAAMLRLTAYVLPDFVVDGWGAALLGTVVLAAVNTVLTAITTIDDDFSFFEGVVQWLSKRRRVEVDAHPGRGLVLLEIDGLSCRRMRRAAEKGYMPTVREMVLNGTHKLSDYDCGLPSQTSSCQAGIMYGDSFDIPAFRWYDKDRRKLVASNNFRDAAEMNARFARGQGLLRGGSSVNNHMAGDARKTLFTMSVLTDRPDDMQRRSLGDLNLFFVNPYMFIRTLLLTLWDVLVELGQGVRQRLRNVRPRVNRLHKGYPFVRAATNVFLRDLATFMVIMDVIRGEPVIYTTFVGYDEVAHHAGPDTSDAMRTLRGFDKQLRRIVDVIERKAPRPYDVILLSDHGQTLGATFEQRYGQTLTEFIEGLLEEKATVTEVNATENSYGHALKLMAEIQAMEQHVPVGRVREATVGRARGAIQGRLERSQPAAMDAQVIVCASGNLANVYFDLRTGKVSLPELNLAYPGLVDALVAHPGVGFVVSYDQDGAPWAFGKDGGRNLQTGAVSGADPLLPYGAPDHRAAQLLGMAGYPHAGDLIVNSSLFPDGQVAAFEELVGSHGGLGGQQTEAFMLHPADMVVRPTSSATEVFSMLDARRGLPGEPLCPISASGVNAWAPKNLMVGVRQVHTWALRLVRALRVDRAVFSEVADDPFATAQALVTVLTILAATALASSLAVHAEGSIPARFAAELVGGLIRWMLIVLFAHTAGRLLRGKGDFTRTMRAMAFAQVPYVVAVLGLLPIVGPLLYLVAVLLVLFATWVALQEALGLRRLVALAVPLLGTLVYLAVALLVFAMVGGAALTLETLLSQFGISTG